MANSMLDGAPLGGQPPASSCTVHLPGWRQWTTSAACCMPETAMLSAGAEGVTHVVHPFPPSGDPDDGKQYMRSLEARCCPRLDGSFQMATEELRRAAGHAKNAWAHIHHAGEQRRVCIGGTTQTHTTSSFQQPPHQQTLSRTRQTLVQTRLLKGMLCRLTGSQDCIGSSGFDGSQKPLFWCACRQLACIFPLVDRQREVQ